MGDPLQWFLEQEFLHKDVCPEHWSKQSARIQPSWRVRGNYSRLATLITGTVFDVLVTCINNLKELLNKLNHFRPIAASKPAIWLSAA